MGGAIPGLVDLGFIRKQAECLRISIAVKRHHNRGNSFKGKHLIVVTHLQFRSSVYDNHGGEHGGMQANKVLEK